MCAWLHWITRGLCICLFLTAGICEKDAAAVSSPRAQPAPHTDATQSGTSPSSFSGATDAGGDATKETEQDKLPPNIGPEDAPALLQEAAIARSFNDSEKAIKLIRLIEAHCAGAREAALGLKALAEMVTSGEAAPALLSEAYEMFLVADIEKWPEVLGESLQYFTQMDSENEWKLHWRYIVLMASSSSSPKGRPFVDLVQTARKLQGKDTMWELVSQAVSNGELTGSGLHNSIRGLLITIEKEEGPEPSMNLARRIISSFPDSPEAGAAALWYAWRLVGSTEGEDGQIRLLKDVSGGDRDTLIRTKAMFRLSDHYILHADLVGAVASLVPGISNDGIFSQRSNVIIDACRKLTAHLDEVKGKVPWTGPRNVWTMLDALATVAEERGLSAVAGELMQKAAILVRPPSVAIAEGSAGNQGVEEVSLPAASLGDKDLLTFWRAYIQWHTGDVSRARTSYDDVLGLGTTGWEAAQIQYDIAEWHLSQLQYDEATRWIQRAVSARPNNTAVTALLTSIGNAAEAEVETDRRVVALRNKMAEDITPEGKAAACLEIADAENARRHFDAAVQVYRELWENYPETPQAPKAMLHAAVILGDQKTDKAGAAKILEELILCYPGDECAAQANALLTGTLRTK